LILKAKNTVVIFGGCYGNLPALQAFFADVTALGIADDPIINTGDSVSYCAEPQAVVNVLRERNVVSIMGNCEESIGNDDDGCGCGFRKGSVCDILSEQWRSYCAMALDAETKEYFRGLPRHIELQLGKRRFWVVHGGIRRINRFLFYSSPQEEFNEEFACFSGDGVIGGHAGLPFTRFTPPHCWHNSGALGMPANDGTPRVWYSVLRVHGDSVLLEHHALKYDYEAAAARIEQTQHLPNAYANTLRKGLWPSLDILPPAERKATGRRLSPTTQVF